MAIDMGGGDWFQQFGGIAKGERDPNGGGPVKVLDLPTGKPGTEVPGGTGGTTTPSGNVTKEEFGRLWLASGGRTVDDLKRFVAAHPEFGVKLGGSKGDKVYGPDGGYWADAVLSAGDGGGKGGVWNTESGGAGGSGGGPGGTLLDPWTQQFHERSPEEIANDPAYQFQLQQGTQAIERGAASKGTLLTGGTLKGVANYGQGLASTYNDKFYNRDMQQYLLKRDNFWKNQDRPYDKLSGLAGLGGSR